MQESRTLIKNEEFAIKEYNGQRVITLKDIDVTHERRTGTADKNFRSNKDKFVEGKDYYFLSFGQNPEIRGFKIAPRGTMVFTRSGYLMIVKSFTDELSWKIQRQLVDNYFNQQTQQPAIAKSCESQPPANNIYAGLRLMLDKLEEHDNDIAVLRKEVRELATSKPKEIIAEPSPEYYLQATNCSVSKNSYMITAIAEAFGMSGQVLNKYLYAQGIIRPHCGGWDINKKAGSESYVMLKTNSFTNRDGIKELRTITYWTYEGMVFLCEYLKAEGFTQSRSIAKFDRNAASKKRTKKKAKAKAKTKKKIDDAQMTLGVK